MEFLLKKKKRKENDLYMPKKKKNLYNYLTYVCVSMYMYSVYKFCLL